MRRRSESKAPALARGTLGENLFRAAEKGDARVICSLAKKGVDLEAKDPRHSTRNRTALMLAADGGHLEAVKLLLEAGAKADACDHWQNTPLVYAAAAGHVDVVKVLIEAHAKIRGDAASGNSAVMAAAKHGHAEVLRTLLRAGFAASTRALERAMDEGHNEVVQALIEARKHGASPAVSPDDLFRALESGQEAVVRRLISMGANVNARNEDEYGATPLIFAAGSDQAVKLLLEAGADVNAQNDKGWSALHVAASIGAVRSAQCLLRKSAKVNLVAKDGETPLDVALAEKKRNPYGREQMGKLIKLLKEHGAKQGVGRHSQPTKPKPKRAESVTCPDFSEAAKRKEFQNAVRELATKLGSQPRPLKDIPGGVRIPPDATVNIEELQAAFLSKGCFVFDVYGGHEHRKGLIVLPTTDKYDAVAAMQTNGCNYELDTADIIQRLRELEKEQTFVLTIIGFDYVTGRFTTPIKDARSLADKLCALCPVEDSAGKLARRLREDPHFTLWWD